MTKTILLVDDNPEMLEALGDELIETYHLLTAMQGKEALEILDKTHVDVVVCDIMMPVMDGLEFCKILKSNFVYSHIPVVLLTAKNTLQSKIEGLEIGADAYVEKPFDVNFLLVQIANLISNRSNLRKYFVQSPIAHIKSIAKTPSDEEFLDRLCGEILNNLNDEQLDVGKLAELMNTSRTSLFRKIKAISDLTPTELITITRLKRAAQLLEETHYKIFEIAYIVGFSSQTSFGRSFQKLFGVTPSEYQKK